MGVQLRMYRPNLHNLGEVIPPEDYKIRTFMNGDEEAWANIVRNSFGSKWDAERCRRELTGLPQFHPEGLFFAINNDKPVGTACAWTHLPDEKKLGLIHMVGVLPEHRGKRLGYHLCLSVLHFFKERNFQSVFLHTDDFRLPAIKTYLNLGFKPEYIDDSHKDRWEKILKELGLL